MAINKKYVLHLMAALCPAALVGCDDGAAAPARRPQGQISDSAHGSTIAGFYWLAPMVASPRYAGVAVANASPSIQIDELGSAGAVTRTVVTFTPGSGSSSVRYDPAAESYIVNWGTRGAALDPALTYRIRALIPRAGASCPTGRAVGAGCEIGFADVDVVSSGNQLRNVQTNEYIPLLDGTTLPIKFRIERAAVDADGDGANNWADNCATLANGDQADTVGNGVGDACRCAAVTCAAPDACHAAGVCQPTTGVCAYANLPDGTACLDGNACNGAETCQSGACTPGAPIAVDDSNACTADACDPASGVSHVAVSIDDGNACTADACDPATGVSHVAVATDDGNACTADACDPTTGVSHVAVTIDDGDACTADACDPTAGVSHTPVSVDDGNACTADSCNPATGVSHVAVSIDDGNACTADVCDPAAGVSHLAIAVDDGNACTADACDPASGVSHAPVSVDDHNACTADACDASTGAISHTANPVDDGNVCTTDACDTTTGEISNTPIAIDDGNPCTADACDPTSGVAHTAVSNGTSCGTGMVCAAGACVSACPAGQTSCGGACVNLAADASNCGACGVACAAGRMCSAGACVAGWTRPLPGRVMKVARDPSGNVYVLLKINSSTGAFSTTGPVVLPTGSVTPSCGAAYCPDYVLLSLDAAGNGRWHRHVVSTGDDLLGELAVDAAGNVYMSHSYLGSVTFPGGSLTAATDAVYNSYILSYDSLGNYRWHRTFVHGGHNGKRSAIALTPNGDVFFGASLSLLAGPVDFGGGAIASPGASPGDFFVASYTSAGAYRWARRFGPSSGAFYTSMALGADAAGNVYGAATVSQATATVTIGSLSFTNAGDDLLLWSLDDAGAVRYARLTSTAAAEQAREIAVAPNGNTYVLGRFSGVVSLLALSPAGTQMRSTTLTGFDATSINLDAAENAYIGGGIGGSVTLAGASSSGGAYDPSVLSLTSSGALRWLRRGSGTTAGITDVTVGGGAVCTGAVDPGATVTETLGGLSVNFTALTGSTALFCMGAN